MEITSAGLKPLNYNTYQQPRNDAPSVNEGQLSEDVAVFSSAALEAYEGLVGGEQSSAFVDSPQESPAEPPLDPLPFPGTGGGSQG